MSRTTFWFWMTVIYTVSTFVLSSFSTLPRFLMLGHHFDWVLHAIEYGILAILVVNYVHAGGWISYRGAPVATVIFCGLVGGANEWYQMFVPHRSAELGDEIANIIGAILFLTVYLAVVARIRSRNLSAAG